MTDTNASNQPTAGYSQVSGIDDGRITLRGRDLVTEVIGQLSFTEAIHLAIRGVLPSAEERAVLDAVLVSLIDHGVTPSTLAARLTLRAAPEAFQGAMAAGVLNSGGRMLGSMEGCGALLAEYAPSVPTDGAGPTAARLVETERAAGRRLPGLGHTRHGDGDPRAARLFEVADEVGRAGVHVALLRQVEGELHRQTGRFMTINVTGAIAALLLDIGYDPGILRGFGILSRVPGIIAHLGEELESGVGGKLVRHLQRPDAWDDIV